MYENLIGDLISTYNRIQDETIIKLLKDYTLLTGSLDVYEMLRDRKVDIHYSEFIKDDMRIYCLDLKDYFNSLKPLELLYSEPEVQYNPETMQYTVSSKVSLQPQLEWRKDIDFN